MRKAGFILNIAAPDFSIEGSETIENYKIYYADLGYDTIATKRADTILLDLGNEFNSYLWSTGATCAIWHVCTATTKPALPGKVSTRFLSIMSKMNTRT